MKEEGILTLRQPGPCALLQDGGRKGLQHLGYSTGGALDEHAFLWSNRILKNPSHTCALEITLGPFVADFSSHAKIALTGAASRIFLNNQPRQPWTSIDVAPGNQLRFDVPKNGMRTYLSIKQGFGFESEFSSASMVMREKSGPYDGKALGKNQQLHYQAFRPGKSPHKAIPTSFIPDYESPLTLKVLLNPHHNFLSPDSLFNFFNSEYSISPNSNRMGYQLVGEKIPTENKSGIFSHGVSFGTIQIPPDGNPIILLKDRQTIGGYPVIGCVSQLDCFALSQKRPGQSVRFSKGNIVDAQLALSEFTNFFSRVC